MLKCWLNFPIRWWCDGNTPSRKRAGKFDDWWKCLVHNFFIYFIQVLKTISFRDSLFRSWFSLIFSSVRVRIILLSSDLVTSWYFNVCCILVSHLRHSGHLDDFEVEGLMISITSISPTGLFGRFGENFPVFVWFCFGFTDCLCLGGGDGDLLLLLSSVSCFNFMVVFSDFCNDGSVYFFLSLSVPNTLAIIAKYPKVIILG